LQVVWAEVVVAVVMLRVVVLLPGRSFLQVVRLYLVVLARRGRSTKELREGLVALTGLAGFVPVRLRVSFLQVVRA